MTVCLVQKSLRPHPHPHPEQALQRARQNHACGQRSRRTNTIVRRTFATTLAVAAPQSRSATPIGVPECIAQVKDTQVQTPRRTFMT